MEKAKVCLLEVVSRRCTLDLINAYLVYPGWLLSRHEPTPDRARLAELELVLSERARGDVLGHLALQYELAQLAHPASQRNGVGVILCEIYLTWLIQYPVRLEILKWGLVLWIERAIVAHISVFLASLFLVTIHRVPFLKLIQEGLLDSYLVGPLAGLHLLSTDL